ncbi:MAG: M56 family metallopeptidase [Actinomycetia bacterium]|nr:M56 family metallopeptidase [Actinomycetes bacterium]
MASVALIVATVSLVAMPLLARRVRAAFRPVELTRYNAVTMSSGVVLLCIALVVCAVPVIVAVGGGSMLNRHFFPGSSIVGWFSAITAVTLIVTMGIGYRRVRKVEDRLRIEPSVGVHFTLAGHELVVLSAHQPLAYAIGGHHPQVVITDGLLEQLSVPELVSVVEHEAAHLSLNHRLHLTLVGMLEPVASWFFPTRWLVDALASALEHAADSQTTDWFATRRALLAISGAPAVAGVAAFTAGNLVDRLDALGGHQATPDTPIRTLMYASAMMLGGISLTTLVVFWL